jgi:hypothetical protein
VLLIAVATAGPARAIDAKPAGSLGVDVFVSPSDDFIKEWVETPATHAPVIRRIREAKVGQLVYVGIALTGYTKSPEGKVELKVDVRVLYPDGTILFEKPGFASYTGTATGPGFVLGDPVMEFMVEDGDPLGEYSIVATAYDATTGKKATSKTTLEVTREPMASLRGRCDKSCGSLVDASDRASNATNPR